MIETYWQTATDPKLGEFSFYVHAETEPGRYGNPPKTNLYAYVVPGPLTHVPPTINPPRYSTAYPAYNGVRSDERDAASFQVNRKPYGPFRVEVSTNPHMPNRAYATSTLYSEWTESVRRQFQEFADRHAPDFFTPVQVARALHSTAQRTTDRAQAALVEAQAVHTVALADERTALIALHAAQAATK